jgi:hypothetical protein
MSPSTGLSVVSREQDLAAWNVRSKFYRCALLPLPQQDTHTGGSRGPPSRGGRAHAPATDRTCSGSRTTGHSPHGYATARSWPHAVAVAPPGRMGWCLRALAGLAVAGSRGEDRYGVLLLSEPALPDVALALAATALALQHYVKQQVRERPLPCRAPAPKTQSPSPCS